MLHVTGLNGFGSAIRSRCSIVLLTALLCSVALGATHTHLSSDSGSQAAITDAARWNPATFVSTDDYTSTFTVRTPTTGTAFTFPGNSLTMNGGSIFWKGSTGGTLTFNQLIFNGGTAIVANSGQTFTLAVSSGSIQFLANATVDSLELNAGVVRTMIINSAISGPGRITIQNASASATPTSYSALTLGGANSNHTGGITVGLRGVLNINSATALGTGTLIISGQGGLDRTTTGTITQTNNNPQSWNSDFAFVGTSGSLTMGSGQVTMSASRIVAVNANTFTVGPIGPAAPFTLQKESPGTLAFAGVNTYTGVTTVNGGTLSIVAGGSINNDPLSGVVVNTGATLNFSRSDTFGTVPTTVLVPITINGGTLKNTGSVYNTLGTINLNGATISAVGGLNTNFNSFGLTSTVNIGGTAASTITSTGTNSAIQLGMGSVSSVNFNVPDVNSAGTDLTVSAVLANGRTDATGTTVQPGNLVKTGAGTLLLSGNSTYTGTTTLTDGTVAVTTLTNGGVAGPLGASTVSSANLVFDGGTLSYSGIGSVSTDRGFTITGGKVANINVAAPTGVMTLSGVGTSNGAVAKTGPGTLNLTGTSTYSGSTSVNTGILGVALLADGGAPSSIGQSDASAGNLVLTGATLRYTGPTVSTNRNFTLSDGTIGTIDIPAGTTLTLSGASAATTGSLLKSGAGTLKLTGPNAHTGNTIVASGTLQVDGSIPSTGNFQVNNGATLSGSGSIAGPVSTNAANLSPGSAAPGKLTLTNSNSLTLDANTTINFELTGAPSATIGAAGNDGIDATGSVNLAGAQINVSGLTVTGANKDFHVIHAASLTGTVTIASATLGYIVTPIYDTASTPKALILRVSEAPRCTWTGAGADAKWSTAANWDVKPVGNANELLIFPAVTNMTATIDAPYAGKSFAALVFQAGGYTIDGVGIKTSTGAPFVGNLSGSNSMLANITLTSNNSVSADAGTTLTLGAAAGVLDNGGFSFALAGAGTINVNSVISGAGGLAQTSSGKSTLFALNTYAGKTSIAAGTLSVSTLADGSLASGIGAAPATAGFLEIGAATLTYTGSGHNSDRIITLTGDATLDASGTGTMTLTGGINGAQNLTLTGTGNASESGTLSLFSGGVTKNGTGTWTLGGINTFTGIDTFNAGVLSVSSINGLGDAASTAGLIFNGGTLQLTGAVDFGTLRLVTLNSAGGTLDVTAAGSGTITTTISGLGGLTKTGPGGLNLIGSNTFSGQVKINGGAINITLPENLGDSSATNSLSFDGGTLGVTSTMNLGATRLVSLLTNGATFDVGASSILTVPAVISGTGSLTKKGAGTLIPSATNTFTGPVNFNGGVLQAQSTSSIGNSAVTNVLNFDGGSL